ncbi:hypothetical protein HG536_0F01430 [Torulaspora globosa]|uniref:GATA-type domain-containing protein n=1 Tax=Torulaspora globosa TaxID=48254 RepID=A0A7G3ZJY2_9SACH|nr:uncharacterized protein HG536_0F01430 [Torulaspora globosa]QLL33818.1 hypothetical protein HG536_0F01430 [Torulaspora globosa]
MSGTTAAAAASDRADGRAGGSGVQGFYYPFQGAGGKGSLALSSSCSPGCSAGESPTGQEASVSSSSSSSPGVGNGAKQAGDGDGKSKVGHGTQHSHNQPHHSHSPVCKNCLTSTTPLWRRDEKGAVLCNACGLFLKLHGRPRPISLKTDVIKSRNRKGAHHQHNHASEGSGSLAEPQHRRSSSDDRKRKQQPGTGSEAKGKKSKVAEDPETRDVCSAANTLETLMSGDASKPRIKPKLKQEASHQMPSPSQSATQLPHLSALLENVRSGSKPAPGILETLSDRSAVSSPSIFAQGHQVANQVPLHVNPLNEPVKPGTSEIVPVVHAPTTQPAAPVSQSCSSTSLVRAGSMSQRYTSPPQSLGTSVPMVQTASALPVSVATPLPLSSVNESARSVHTGQSPLSILYKNEEEVIRLKTRINELELVTDLYKRHIFDLDEKCRELELEIESLKR